MDFEATANELTKVSEKGLSNVSSLCKKQLQLEDRVKELKAELKETERVLREISQDLLPSAMQEQNLWFQLTQKKRSSLESEASARTFAPRTGGFPRNRDLRKKTRIHAHRAYRILMKCTLEPAAEFSSP